MGRKIDLLGLKFGQLTVIENSEKRSSGSVMWLCKCICGKEKLVRGKHLRGGNIRSCGCSYKGTYKTHGMTNTRLYHIWASMKERCNNKSIKCYHNYGGRGIKVCEEWEKDFMNFYNWAVETGYNESLSIDRIDVNSNYEPSNCRWATMKEQNNNRRNNRLIEFEGKVKTLMQWAEEFKINDETLSGRLDRGWDIERALKQPVRIFKTKTL